MIERHLLKTRDKFVLLHPIILSFSSSSSIEPCSQRSATELLDESKAFFVKSQEVLRNRQTLLNNRTANEQLRLTPSFRIA